MLKWSISDLSCFSPFSDMGQKRGFFRGYTGKRKKRGRAFTVIMYKQFLSTDLPSILAFHLFQLFQLWAIHENSENSTEFQVSGTVPKMTTVKTKNRVSRLSCL